MYTYIRISPPLRWWIKRRRGSERACCCSTRVCQCLPVSTPTYLCKSFNLTPPPRIPREIVSRNLFVFIASNGGERHRSDPQQPYDRVSLVPTLLLADLYIDVKSCATRALRASLHPKKYPRKLMYVPLYLPYLSLIQPRDRNTYIYTYVTPVYDVTEERAASFSAFYYNVYTLVFVCARGVLGLTKENTIFIL